MCFNLEEKPYKFIQFPNGGGCHVLNKYRSVIFIIFNAIHLISEYDDSLTSPLGAKGVAPVANGS